MTARVARDPRETFARTAVDLVTSDPAVALVYAEISGALFAAAKEGHGDRVINVGIREQLLVSAAAGLALTGLRPVVHTFSPFLVERAFEQLKLDVNHQDVGLVLVSVGGSYDWSAAGRTHQSPADVALLDTLAGWTVHVPGHADEVESALRTAVADRGRHYLRLSAEQNDRAHRVAPGRLLRVAEGSRAAVVAVGPLLQPTLAATTGLDVSVLYAPTVRPFDTAGLRAALPAAPVAEVVLVEPMLEGTSSRVVSQALVDRPHRLLALGVGQEELRRYGEPTDHARAHGLDARGIRASITRFLATRGAA